MRTLFSTVAVGAFSTVFCHGETAPDKSSYTLINPVPAALLREFTTDRPDMTDNPFTVDAGRSQLEMEFGSFARDVSEGTRTEQSQGGSLNLRLGLFARVEAGIFFSPYIHSSTTSDGGKKETLSGGGDVGLRGKFNFWGNDGGPTAFGLILDLALPTSRRGLGRTKTEGAVSFPLALKLGAGWDLGLMSSAEFRARPTSGYIAVWNNTASFGHSVSNDLSGYLELTSSTGDGPHVATFDFGLAWSVRPNTQLDLGANVGLSRAADDLVVFSGLSQRF